MKANLNINRLSIHSSRYLTLQILEKQERTKKTANLEAKAKNNSQFVASGSLETPWQMTTVLSSFVLTSTQWCIFMSQKVRETAAILLCSPREFPLSVRATLKRQFQIFTKKIYTTEYIIKKISLSTQMNLINRENTRI